MVGTHNDFGATVHDGHVAQAGRIDQVVLAAQPRQALSGLPATPAEFAGRAAELDALLALLAGPSATPASPSPGPRLPPGTSSSRRSPGSPVSARRRWRCARRTRRATTGGFPAVFCSAASGGTTPRGWSTAGRRWLHPGNRALVTSRNMLADLAGARHFRLAVLTPRDVLGLPRRVPVPGARVAPRVR
ncbi:hypothetical protein [Saccharopolyspora erythraea]|uniref:Uncharacterized protein n=1 Tax=Saccharopolyspora erythraea (strain ATCC 11635 / DSM 40517 / JCM 4748 / NBRC 13426 / NCIMB 8594 / NRRL 2338) TaxID=405948 RepID=A4FEI9_SACEN|nr:hypothetical protein [Saccharopolyspora erythraea]CAM02464.1 hypothetical protein SACE_3188 [Saccharopolyspora erythraea NRRL 2338]